MTALELIDQKIAEWIGFGKANPFVSGVEIEDDVLSDLQEIRKAVEDGN